MKPSVFILSLLLILERQTTVVGQYGTKGGFAGSSFMKGHVNYGLKGASDGSAEENVFMQTKHQVYGQGHGTAQTRLSHEHAGLKGASLCRQGQVKSQDSQMKSYGQTKSSMSQMKSLGQLKSYGQTKSSMSQMKSLGQLKSYGQEQSLESQMKSYGQVSQMKSLNQLKSQDGQLKSYSQQKSYGEEAQLNAYGHQLKSQDGQLKSYSQQKSYGEEAQLNAYDHQLKSQDGQLKSFSQNSLKGFSQQNQHKGFAMDEQLSQRRKSYDGDDSVQQKSSQQIKSEEDLSFGQQRHVGQENAHAQSYKGYLDRYKQQSQDQFQQKRSFNQDSYFTKGGAGLYQTQLKG